jgi:nucleoid DNA-binding protein
MREALSVPGGSVVFRNVGTLLTYEREPREYRSPTTGEMHPARSDLAVRFQTSHNLWEST